MALFDDLTKNPISTVLLGIGVAMVAPSLFPNLASNLRPLAKAIVKGGVTLYDAAKEGIAEAGEQLDDLVAESRAELAAEERTRNDSDSRSSNNETSSRRGRSRTKS